MPDVTKTVLPKIRDYLTRCREITQLCSQNGWIDNETLRIDIERCDDAEARVAVRFTEVIMEGGGCVADRRECYGKLIVAFGPDGRVQSCVIV